MALAVMTMVIMVVVVVVISRLVAHSFQSARVKLLLGARRCVLLGRSASRRVLLCGSAGRCVLLHSAGGGGFL